MEIKSRKTGYIKSINWRIISLELIQYPIIIRPFNTTRELYTVIFSINNVTCYINY